jgi:4-amino-4-deoxychorismate lyase
MHFRDQQPIADSIALDRGLLYGDAVFTSIALIEGQLLLLDEHLLRLKNDAARLKFADYDFDSLRQELQSTYSQQNAVVRVALSRGTGVRGYAYNDKIKPVLWHGVSAYPDGAIQKRSQGIVARICDTRLAHNPLLAGIKHANRLEQIMARSEWQAEPNSETVSEGLMLDYQDRVIEGTMSNLFMLKDERCYTPKLNEAGVSGIMRGQVIKALAELNVELEQCQLTTDDLFNADGLFVSNAVIGVWPVIKLQTQDFPIAPLMSKLVAQLATNNAI